MSTNETEFVQQVLYKNNFHATRLKTFVRNLYNHGFVRSDIVRQAPNPQKQKRHQQQQQQEQQQYCGMEYAHVLFIRGHRDKLQQKSVQDFKTATTTVTTRNYILQKDDHGKSENEEDHYNIDNDHDSDTGHEMDIEERILQDEQKYVLVVPQHDDGGTTRKDENFSYWNVGNWCFLQPPSSNNKLQKYVTPEKIATTKKILSSSSLPRRRSPSSVASSSLPKKSTASTRARATEMLAVIETITYPIELYRGKPTEIIKVYDDRYGIEKVYIWSEGWLKVMIQKEQHVVESYWTTPKMKYKFTSVLELKRFLMALTHYNGNEYLAEQGKHFWTTKKEKVAAVSTTAATTATATTVPVPVPPPKTTTARKITATMPSNTAAGMNLHEIEKVAATTITTAKIPTLTATVTTATTTTTTSTSINYHEKNKKVSAATRTTLTTSIPPTTREITTVMAATRNKVSASMASNTTTSKNYHQNEKVAATTITTTAATPPPTTTSATKLTETVSGTVITTLTATDILQLDGRKTKNGGNSLKEEARVLAYSGIETSTASQSVASMNYHRGGQDQLYRSKRDRKPSLKVEENAARLLSSSHSDTLDDDHLMPPPSSKKRKKNNIGSGRTTSTTKAVVKTTSSTSRAGVLGQSAEVYNGPPTDQLDIESTSYWPEKWIQVKIQRQSGQRAGLFDSYWITPDKTCKLRSTKEVREYVPLLQRYNGNELLVAQNLRKKGRRIKFATHSLTTTTTTSNRIPVACNTTKTYVKRQTRTNTPTPTHTREREQERERKRLFPYLFK